MNKDIDFLFKQILIIHLGSTSLTQKCIKETAIVKKLMKHHKQG